MSKKKKKLDFQTNYIIDVMQKDESVGKELARLNYEEIIKKEKLK